VTINCPLECPYLAESRRHENHALDRAKLPHPEVQVSEQFLQRSDMVLVLLSAFLNKALQPVPNATDLDVREALESLIQSTRASDSGLIYDARPANPIAAGIAERFRESLGDFTKELKNREGASSVFSDKALLTILVFMARVAYGHDNGRPRCRAFIHYLRQAFPTGAPGRDEPPKESLIITP
jgi:hypothetical protein